MSEIKSELTQIVIMSDQIDLSRQSHAALLT